MDLGSPFPSLSGVDWIVDPRESDMAPSSRGGVLLVHFWSTGCPLCEEGARDIARWRARFGGSGDLRTIAVFQPRPDQPQPSRIDVERLARDAMAIDYPCILDRDCAVARRFENKYAPAYFVFDDSRRLRHRQMGNAGLEQIDSLLERLVKASAAGGANPAHDGTGAS